jgi:hypothetical protein
MKKTTSCLPCAAPAVAAACAALLAVASVRADDLRIENVKTAPRDAKSAVITFDIAWSNSWRHGSYHDAAWVFFKTRSDAKAEWQHVRLVADRVTNPSGCGAGEGTPLEFVVPGGVEGFTGMFVRRAAEGKSPVVAKGVTVMADLDATFGNLKPETRNLKPEVCAFGIEMTYVAEGPFYLGSGGNELNAFYTYTGNDTSAPPYRVISAGAIPTGREKGKLWAKGIAPPDGGEIPAAFPNGYAAFYAMKRPYFTQSLYAGFLNTITATHAKPRWYPDYQGVAIKRSGVAPNYVYVAGIPAARCPWLSSGDGAAVAAWAGLRLMTELELEKAIRGDEYPGLSDATPSYWGILDVNGGSFYERPVSAGNAVGLRFAGTHGRGAPVLPADWPATADGVIFRGADFQLRYAKTPHHRTSGRINAHDVHADRKAHPFAGWRGARTAPAGDTIVKQTVARFDPAGVRPVARLGGAVRADSAPDGWGEPLASLSDPANLFPVQTRFTPNDHCQSPWQGPADASAKVYLGWANNALFLGVVVTDDKLFNTKAGGEISNGDAIQFGLVNPKGVHFNLALALTTNGVVIHQFMGEGDTLSKTAERSVVRDDQSKLTRYGLRIPFAAVGLKPGDEFAFNIMVIDGDDERGMRHNLQMATGISYPFRTELYPRFLLQE